MKSNIMSSTVEALQEMVHESFVMTSLIDRMQSVLDAELSYNNTASLLHHGMAHRYSGYFADMIAEMGLQGYDISVQYGNVPLMTKSYSTVRELLYELKDKIFVYQNKLNGCYKIAFENDDFHIVVDLQKIISEHNQIVKQIILLCNKIDMYNDNPSFDAHIKDHFWILNKED